MVLDGIFHRVRTGCPWRDLPEQFGNWKTVYGRHRRWSGDGTWEQILDALRAGCDQAEGVAWTVAADAMVIRAHQHAACAGTGSGRSPSPPTRPATGSAAAAAAAGRQASIPMPASSATASERAFCRLRQHRAVATQYDKRDFVYRGTADAAAIRIWLRDLTQQDLRDSP